jgi:hypothetical protein
MKSFKMRITYDTGEKETIGILAIDKRDATKKAKDIIRKKKLLYSYSFTLDNGKEIDETDSILEQRYKLQKENKLLKNQLLYLQNLISEYLLKMNVILERN